jgi:tRNA-specific 2-thiouridylase
VAIDGPNNALIVGPEQDLFQDRLLAVNINWIACAAPRQALRVKAQIRQQHKEAEATLTPVEGGTTASAQVIFDQPQMSIAPGQAIVFYQEDLVIGGGIIA